MPGATLDLDFAGGRYWQNGKSLSADPTSLLTTTRNSTAYIDNLAGVWTAYTANLFRWSDKGALIEEARTNSVRNNSMQGAVAGAPGTNPTNWAITLAPVGLTKTIVGTGTSNGIDYIDVRYSGTASGAGAANWVSDTGQGAVASQGQAWSMSGFVALVSGSLTNISLIRWSFDEYATGSFLSQQLSADFKASLTTVLQRFTHAATTAEATVNNVKHDLQINITGAGAVDLTLRYGWPQLELGLFTTSPVRTTTVAVTRAADVVTLTTAPTFGTSYTLLAYGTPGATLTYATAQSLIDIDDASSNNRFFLRRDATTGRPNVSWTAGGVSDASVNTTAVATGTRFKMAAATDGTNATLSLNGAAVLSKALGGTILTPTVVRIGEGSNSAIQFNGYIDRVALWANFQVPNPSLIGLTA